MKQTMDLPISDALNRAANLLRPRSVTARQDASVLLAHILKRSRGWIVAHPEVLLSAEERASLDQAFRQASKGVPLPYILGHWEFFGLDFIVNPEVLIPRPETELLVTMAIGWLTAHPGRQLVADIGTGSGCIAISLAVNLPDLAVLATELSAGALNIAEKNIRRHAVENRVTLIKGDLVDELPEPVDVLCANLPYIPSQELEILLVSRYEPHLALDGGADGLLVIRRLLSRCPRWIKPEGLILLEIEASLGSQVEEIAKTHFPKAAIQCKQDLAGYDRLVLIELENK